MKVTRQRMERLADHPHDDTIIAAAQSLLRDRAAKLLTLASEHREGLPTEYRKAILLTAAHCTAAGSAVESALQSIADLEIRYGGDNGEVPPDAA